MPILGARDNFNEKGRRLGFKVTNFTPSTGIGKFDAAYDAAAKELRITVKLFFIFAVRPGGTPWQANDQVRWQANFIRIVEEFWSECYTITADKDGFRDLYVKVLVRIQPAASKAASHYSVKAFNLARGETSGAGIDRGNMELLIGRWDLEPEDRVARDKGALEFKARQIQQVVNQTGASFLPFPASSSQMPVDVKLTLNALTNGLRSIVTSAVAATEVKIYVYGKKAGTESGITNLTTGKNRSKAVAEYINSKMGFADFARVVSSAGNEPWIVQPVESILRAKVPRITQADVQNRAFQGVILLVKDPGAGGVNLTGGLARNYCVATHEVGHMFGLPDEYFGVNCLKLERQIDLLSVIPDSVRNLSRVQAAPREPGQAEGFAALLQATNLPSPVFMNSRSTVTTSVMYAGSDVLPAHYLTFWEALLNMTYPLMQPNEWKIVPNGVGSGKQSNVELFAH